MQAAALESDLADPAFIPKLFDQVEATLGPLEVPVNNAAYWEADTFLPSGADLPNNLVELWTDRPQSLNVRALDRMFAVNSRAPALMIACDGRVSPLTAIRLFPLCSAGILSVSTHPKEMMS